MGRKPSRKEMTKKEIRERITHYGNAIESKGVQFSDRGPMISAIFARAKGLMPKKGMARGLSGGNT